jgi:hypothetical protein
MAVTPSIRITPPPNGVTQSGGPATYTITVRGVCSTGISGVTGQLMDPSNGNSLVNAPSSTNFTGLGWSMTFTYTPGTRNVEAIAVGLVSSGDSPSDVQAYQVAN